MNMKISDKWIIWIHAVDVDDWTINGYKQLPYVIDSVESFWKVMNNLDKFGVEINNIFIMKEGIEPIWESVDNRKGGQCSFRSDIGTSMKLLENLFVRILTNTLTKENNYDTINGISISPKINNKYSWGIVKIWNSDKSIDLSKEILHDVAEEYNKKYKNVSIRYKQNEPEY